MTKKIFESENLYHFTKFCNALQILSSKTLLFGKYSNMNDINEATRLTCTESFNMKDKKKKEEYSNLQKEIELYQQLSFTMDFDDNFRGFELTSMWGHYAENGFGVCLVFDKNSLLQQLNTTAKHKRVRYVSDISNFKDIGGDDVFDEVFFKKSFDWKFENEYRVITKQENNALEKLDIHNTLKCVVLYRIDFNDMRYSNLKHIIQHDINVPILKYSCLLNQYSLSTEDKSQRYVKDNMWVDLSESEPFLL